MLLPTLAHAGSATWNASPRNGDWNNAANWTPTTVPNGPDDVATFGISSRATVSLSAATEVSSIVFTPGASAFTISVPPLPAMLTISGVGITNNSGKGQTLQALANGGTIHLPIPRRRAIKQSFKSNRRAASKTGALFNSTEARRRERPRLRLLASQASSQKFLSLKHPLPAMQPFFLVPTEAVQSLLAIRPRLVPLLLPWSMASVFFMIMLRPQAEPSRSRPQAESTFTTEQTQATVTSCSREAITSTLSSIITVSWNSSTAPSLTTRPLPATEARSQTESEAR